MVKTSRDHEESLNVNYRNASKSKLKETHKDILPSVNWHITKKCNFNCKYCFARFNDLEGILPKEVALKIPKQLKNLGVEKLNIAGGEPLLYPHLMDVLKESKKCGLTVTMISNGSLLNENNIKEMSPYLDWIGISLDSCDEEIQYQLGRGSLDHLSNVIKKTQLIKKYGMGLKINTVVTKLNMNEDMTQLIHKIGPDRWKVFQVMEREGENQNSVKPLLITSEEFQHYCNENDMVLENDTRPKFESNELMRESYLMLGPQGKFFHSSNGPIEYIDTDPLDLASSIDNVPFDDEAFTKRGGFYRWNLGETHMENNCRDSQNLVISEEI